VKQVSPGDVIRGEETQIVGFLARNPTYDGILCLPGTHSKWVHVSAREIVSFRTFLTGELFALLSRSSVLHHSVASDGWDDDAFTAALSDTIAKPETLASALFSIRAEALLHNLQGATARARLSGLLIGSELAAARPYWLGQQVALIGEPDLCHTYATALQAQGVSPILAEGPAMTLAGLAAAYANWKETG
jgi:2-dehydro-3-deoxygalactonokinase